MTRGRRDRPHDRPSGRPGATARRGSTPSPTAPEPTAVGGSRLTARAAVLLLVLLVLVISYASSARAWWQQRADIAEARADVDAAEQRLADLERDQRRLDDPAYIEQQARERFGFVMPGEVGYRVLDEDGEPLDDDTELQVQPRDDGPEPAWYDDLWGSVEEAGEEPPDPDEVDDTPVLRGPQGAGPRGGGPGDGGSGAPDGRR